MPRPTLPQRHEFGERHEDPDVNVTSLAAREVLPLFPESAEAFLNNDDFVASTSRTSIEKTRILKRTSVVRKFRRVAKEHRLKSYLQALPLPEETWHFVTCAEYDFFQVLPVCLNLMHAKGALVYSSTWAMSRTNGDDLIELLDRGIIGELTLLTGTYFKRRNPPVYFAVSEGLKRLGQRLHCGRNHAKVSIIGPGPAMPSDSPWIIIEGSANYTANPRTEQFSITNSRELWCFMRNWMEEILGDQAHCQTKR